MLKDLSNATFNTLDQVHNEYYDIFMSESNDKFPYALCRNSQTYDDLSDKSNSSLTYASSDFYNSNLFNSNQIISYSNASTQIYTPENVTYKTNQRSKLKLTFDDQFMKEETFEPFLYYDFQTQESIWINGSEKSDTFQKIFDKTIVKNDLTKSFSNDSSTTDSDSYKNNKLSDLKINSYLNTIYYKHHENDDLNYNNNEINKIEYSNKYSEESNHIINLEYTDTEYNDDFLNEFVSNITKVIVSNPEIQAKITNRNNFHSEKQKGSNYYRSLKAYECIKVGDWVCPDCGNTNYRKRVECNICKYKKCKKTLKVNEVHQNYFRYSWN
eukprot:Mrub_04086.p1 GENE.Mrub_04086~~Mrub_04086.p1  ORF type:complete len:327 (+),score=32.49 Mrub_04086:210-1190(+)